MKHHKTINIKKEDDTMKIDMHNHTKYSIDSISNPADMISAAQKRGLSGIAITDHNTFKGFQSIRNKIKSASDFLIIPGMEIKVTHENKKIGELLAYFIDEEIKSRDVFEVIDDIHNQDGFISVAHPFRLNIKFNMLDDVKKSIDAIEVFNARAPFTSSNQQAMAYAKKNKLGYTAGSDSHCLYEIGRCGIEADCQDIEEFRKLIKKGRCKIFGRKSPIWVHCISTFTKIRKRIF